MNAGGLERDIFGGSDSELSEDEDARPQNHTRQQSTGSEEDYNATQGSSSGRKRTQRGSDASKHPKKRRRKRETQLEDTGVDLDPEQQRRLELSQTIDAIVKPNKSRPKKKKKDEDILDHFADEEVKRLKHAMHLAAANDVESNDAKRPATSKLRMLPEVMDILQKQGLQQSIFDNNLLQGVANWLEPLPDRSLPALNIQNAFFEVFPKLDIDTNTLKESGLGKIVLFYTLCKRVTPPIKRQAEHLVDIWSRPIIKRSASYKDRHIPTGEAKLVKFSVAGILQQNQQTEQEHRRRNAAAIPEKPYGTYIVAPKSVVASTGPAAVESEKRRVNADRLRKMQRKLALHKQKSARL